MCQPGLVFFYQAWGAMIGFGVRQMNYALIAIWLGVLFCIWQVGRTVLPVLWAAIAAACTFVFCFPIQPLYHICATALLVGAVALVQQGPNSRLRFEWQTLIAGFLAGAGFVIMQSRGAIGGLLLLAWIWRRNGRKAAILFLCAAAVPLLAVASYFAIHRALPDWFHYTFVFPLGRSARGTWSGWHILVDDLAGSGMRNTIRQSIRFVPVLLAPLLAVIAAMNRRSAPARVQLLGLLACAQMIAVLYGPALACAEHRVRLAC
jgi:hypothetical protein